MRKSFAVIDWLGYLGYYIINHDTMFLELAEFFSCRYTAHTYNRNRLKFDFILVVNKLFCNFYILITVLLLSILTCVNVQKINEHMLPIQYFSYR